MRTLVRSSRCWVPLAFVGVLLPQWASAAPWQIDPDRVLPGAGDVTQKVELVDIDADGFVDLVFANSRGDSTGSDADAQLNQLVRNDQGLGFVEVAGVFDEPDNAYVIRAGDLDHDGDPDLVVGVNFGGQSYVLLQDEGALTRLDIGVATVRSIGDLELGDVDGDGHLDALAADWGSSQPFDDPLNTGGLVRLWLGDGGGHFTDGGAQLPIGIENLVSWSFDVELLDLDNDFDLDAAIASRGAGHALVLVNDGAGNFAVHPVPPLQPPNGKQINSAFTVVDLDADGNLDLVTLQDGPASGNTVLIGDGAGNFADNVGAYWALVDNPPRLDFDAASLDFDNDGTPDLVVTGTRINPGEVNSRLMLNDGASLEPVAPDGAAFPALAELDATFGVLLADLDHDGRDDAAVAVRDELAANVVLFGSEDVPEDITPPRIDLHELVPPDVVPGEWVRVRARVHDAKLPARWHDFLHDPLLDTYNLPVVAATAHQRRLPYLEFAVGLFDPGELMTLPDDHPGKFSIPGEWYGEALWRIEFPIPAPQAPAESLAWRVCAIDAAGNKACTAISTSWYPIEPHPDCGDGVVQEWEDCDDEFDPLCVDCVFTCGNGLCDANESMNTCPDDCGEWDTGSACGDDLCTPPESALNCPVDCGCAHGICTPECPENCGGCGDGVCEAPENAENCPVDCVCDDCGDPTVDQWCGDGVCSPAELDVCFEDCGPECLDTCEDSGTGGTSVDDEGCGCRGAPAGGGFGLLLLALLTRRRRRFMV